MKPVFDEERQRGHASRRDPLQFLAPRPRLQPRTRTRWFHAERPFAAFTGLPLRKHGRPSAGLSAFAVSLAMSIGHMPSQVANQLRRP